MMIDSPCSAVVAQRIDVPPGVAVRRYRPSNRGPPPIARRPSSPKAPPSARPPPDARCPPPDTAPGTRLAPRPAEGRHPAMRGRAVERPARGRKQLVEFRRRRQHRGREARSTVSPCRSIKTKVPSSHCATSEAVYSVRIAGGGRVDETRSRSGPPANSAASSPRSCAQT